MVFIDKTKNKKHGTVISVVHLNLNFSWTTKLMYMMYKKQKQKKKLWSVYIYERKTQKTQSLSLPENVDWSSQM